MNPKNWLEHAAYEVRLTEGRPGALTLERRWDGAACRISLQNTGPAPVCLKEVAVFCADMPFPAATPFYGEGYNMLSQYKGTLESFGDITNLSDRRHYKLPQADGFSTVYNLLLLFPGRETVLLGFSSCRRFAGELRFNPHRLEVVIDGEGVRVGPGETLDLEEVYAVSGPHRDALLDEFGDRIRKNHPLLPYPEIPVGWCSWYAYGPSVTEQDIFNNLATIKQRMPDLKFIQIDDGYQKHMGDWLQQHPNFPSPIRDLCLKIKDEGFEPAIWVAPFIAEKDSDLFRDHPDWFIKDDIGQPLSSGDVSFGGWRYGPWYMLDGTHPEARDYLRHVFRTMREKWQCRYFKLDANMWGAMPFGHRHDPAATRIEAYRAGMQAVLEGAGDDSFILGCNAPMWPSLGVVHGMRVTGDIARRWKTFRGLAEEGFSRNWQHGALWINDPDCIVLNNLFEENIGPDGKLMTPTTEMTDDEFSFHAAYILASGGMVLASDRMMDLDDRRYGMLRKLVPPVGRAARFDARDFRVGRIETGEDLLVCLFNETDERIEASAPLEAPCDLADFWTDAPLAASAASVSGVTLPPHSARVIRCRPTAAS